jgi:hypothetical protein
MTDGLTGEQATSNHVPSSPASAVRGVSGRGKHLGHQGHEPVRYSPWTDGTP